MSKEMLELADAGKRHAEGLTAQLDNPNWMPKRAHIEQARNSIAKLAALLRASAVAPAAPVPASVREAPEIIHENLPEYSGNPFAAPEAAPTREETIEQCAKVCDRWIRSKNLHESLAAADISKDILALKSAPSK